MGRKSKVDPEKKAEAILDYLNEFGYHPLLN